jgi:hypothetical protein
VGGLHWQFDPRENIDCASLQMPRCSRHARGGGERPVGTTRVRCWALVVLYNGAWGWGSPGSRGFRPILVLISLYSMVIVWGLGAITCGPWS